MQGCFVTEPRRRTGQRAKARAQGLEVGPRTYAGDAPCCALTMRPKSISEPAWLPAGAVVTTRHSGRVCNALGKARPGALSAPTQQPTFGWVTGIFSYRMPSVGQEITQRDDLQELTHVWPP